MLLFKTSTVRIVIRAINNYFQLGKGLVLLHVLLLEKSLFNALKLSFIYKRHFSLLIKRSSLFDAIYYLEVNHDVADHKAAPLRHYIAYGDKEGRCPMPFFDPNYYRSQLKGRLKNSNTLLHYLYVGRYLKLALSPWFDAAYYLRENKDVARSGIDPLLHYLKWGGKEGRSPCEQFNGLYYLQTNQDVVDCYRFSANHLQGL